jgi:hypothetical protein
MNFKALFAREVGIRLTDDLSGFVCTVRRGWFHTKADEFGVEPRPAQPLGRSTTTSFLNPLSIVRAAGISDRDSRTT